MAALRSSSPATLGLTRSLLITLNALAPKAVVSFCWMLLATWSMVCSPSGARIW